MDIVVFLSGFPFPFLFFFFTHFASESEAFGHLESDFCSVLSSLRLW